MALTVSLEGLFNGEYEIALVLVLKWKELGSESVWLLILRLQVPVSSMEDNLYTVCSTPCLCPKKAVEGDPSPWPPACTLLGNQKETPGSQLQNSSVLAALSFWSEPAGGRCLYCSFSVSKLAIPRRYINL